MGPQLPALSAPRGGEGEFGGAVYVPPSAFGGGDRGRWGPFGPPSPVGVSRQALAACSSSGSSRSATGVACQPSARLDQ